MSRTWRTPSTVYPRVGGGTTVTLTVLEGNGGLSPRGRGNRDKGEAGGMLRGSIPAWAGEPAGSPW